MADPFVAPPLAGHEVLDSGMGEKLERFGAVTLRRPDPQALWKRRRPEAEWTAADLTFVRESDRGGRWVTAHGGRPGPSLQGWELPCEGTTLLIRPTPFKHVGLFPEQSANWAFLEGVRHELSAHVPGSSPRLLNLFGYTGAASVLAAARGWDVTHVDASKTSVTWAVDNAQASGLGRDAMRVVVEDAMRFARRELRRGSRYHAVLLDPPHYGRGPKGEVWRLEEHLAEMVELSLALAEERACVVLSTYAVGYSPLAYRRMFEGAAAGTGGRTEVGELALREASRPGEDGAERLLPAGYCARWARGCAHGGA